ncbi:hypothetical protein B0H16DRAFT_1469948 [Mycena metata]|uniref:Uncharacterized protein n=1 Tax=Mycena metata TaxID=1033252 RepID=A0AAD7HVX7_9AGAR|nr:hypothetical protein B0H16DRAFT_1469948 [Mycena metata]
MGTEKNREKKKKKVERNSGARKAKAPAPESTPPQRPLPRRITIRGPAPPVHPPLPSEESAAAATLVSLSAGSQPLREDSDPQFKARMDHVFAAAVPGVSVGDFEEKGDGKGQSGSDSESSIDQEPSELGSDSENDDLDSAVIASSPASAAAARKNKFSITFEVPVGKTASRDIEISSMTTFDAFLDKLATTMCTRKSLLSDIAYLPSYVSKTPKPRPKMLDDEDAWKALIKGAAVWIEKCKAKKKGKGEVTVFTIQIIDTSGEDTKAAGGGAKKGKKSKAAADDIPAPSKEKEFYRQIEQKHHCAEHDKTCTVLSTGKCYHFTPNDLSKWALLVSKGLATIADVPDELKIEDAAPRQHKAKKIIERRGEEPPTWIQSFLPFMGMALGGAARNNLPFETPHQTQPPSQPIAGSSRQSALLPDPPSSGTKREASAAAPSMNQWLLSLDEDIHGVNYFQYHAVFAQNGIYDLTDMEDLEICPVGEGVKRPRRPGNRSSDIIYIPASPLLYNQ